MLTMNNLLMSYPQEDNDWLMARFIATKYTAEEHMETPSGPLPLGYPRGFTRETVSSIKFSREVVNEAEMGI